MELEKIKVIKNFLSIDDANKIINYINNNIHNSVDYDEQKGEPRFVHFKDRFYKRIMGLDDKMSVYTPERSISNLYEIESLVKDISVRINKTIKEVFSDDDDIYLNSLFLVKHLKKDFLRLHSDSGDGYQQHFAYSSVLYLNTVEDGGELEFPNLGITIKPIVGDLVLFITQAKNMDHEVKVTNEERYTMPMWFTKDKTREVQFV
jgi:Rps23 Pro-64 3,4-dihydroxylase Tpa1-like proline 4-hydroxylase